LRRYIEGRSGDSRLLFVDHEKKEAVDAGQAGKEDSKEAGGMGAGARGGPGGALSEEERVDAEVDQMMSEGAAKRKYRTEAGAYTHSHFSST